ncbi:MAG: tetratricopeptide repeat protein [Hyphomicrobiaceae bacterium]
MRSNSKRGTVMWRNRPAVRSKLAVATALLGLLATFANAEIATDCFSQDNERRFAGCTEIIENPNANQLEKAQAYSMRALAYSLKQRYEEAINDYTAAIDINPSFAVALNNRAWAYYKWGRGDKGLPDVERSLRINPSSEHTWDTRAHIRQSMGDHTGAFSDYEQAVGLGGPRMIKLYQCGLSATGRYRGRLDGIYSDEFRDALKTCASSRTCDPLPADEECKDPVS